MAWVRLQANLRIMRSRRTRAAGYRRLLGRTLEKRLICEACAGRTGDGRKPEEPALPKRPPANEQCG